MKSMQKKYDSLEELVADYKEKTEIVSQIKELDETELSASQKQTIKEQEELSDYLQNACQALDFVKFSTTVTLNASENESRDKIECRSLLDSKEQYVRLYATLTNGGERETIEAIERNRQPIENFEKVKAENDIFKVSTVKELEQNTSVAFQLDDIKESVVDFFGENGEISIADFENSMMETFSVMEQNGIEKNGEVAFATANLAYEKNLAGESNVLAYENSYDLSKYKADHEKAMEELANKEETTVEQPDTVILPEKTEKTETIEETILPEKAVKEEVETPELTAEISKIELPDDTVVVTVDNTVVMQNIPTAEEIEVDNYVGRNIDDIINEKFDLVREDIEKETVTIETPNDKTEIVLVPIENTTKNEENKADEFVVAVEGAVVFADDEKLIGQELEEVVKEQVRQEKESKMSVEIKGFGKEDAEVVIGSETTADNKELAESIKADIKGDIEDIQEHIEEDKKDIEEQKQDEIEEIEEQIEEEIEEQIEEQYEYDDM